MSRLGRAVLSGSEILSLDEVARVDAVSHEDITSIAGELFVPERFSIAGIGPTTIASTSAVGGEVALLEAVA